MLFNALNVWFRDISPAAIKNEPEEDNGFYPPPQHNKASRRKSDDEEFVSLVLNFCTSLMCKTIRWCMCLACLTADLSPSPKKSRRSMIKSQGKGNMSMKKKKKKMTMRRRRYLCLFFWCLCLHFKCALGLFFQDLFSLASGHQTQEEEKRQKCNRRKEIQKGWREVEMVGSFLCLSFREKSITSVIHWDECYWIGGRRNDTPMAPSGDSWSTEVQCLRLRTSPCLTKSNSTTTVGLAAFQSAWFILFFVAFWTSVVVILQASWWNSALPLKRLPRFSPKCWTTSTQPRRSSERTSLRTGGRWDVLICFL